MKPSFSTVIKPFASSVKKYPLPALLREGGRIALLYNHLNTIEMLNERVKKDLMKGRSNNLYFLVKGSDGEMLPLVGVEYKDGTVELLNDTDGEIKSFVQIEERELRVFWIGEVKEAFGIPISEIKDIAEFCLQW